jgi:HEAT repeat protein
MARTISKRFSLSKVSAVLFAVAASSVVTLAALSPSSPQLLEKFATSRVFWEQREVAEQLVALHDPGIPPKLIPWLTNDDRHIRANAAYVFAKYGDKRGFDVICAILDDRSDRPEGQGAVGPVSIITSSNDPHAATNYRKAHHLEWQIPADRYYAATMLGNLRDPRAVPILVPLLSDKEVKLGIPWALAEIGDKSAITPLIKSLSDDDPSFRVVVIRSLERLHATEAIPALTLLLNDRDSSHVDDLVPVAEAARQAIERLKGREP